MARSREHMVQRGHVFAIVDEVDSILIDEARTPLIISGPADEAAQALLPVRLHRPHPRRATTDYEVDEEKRTVVPLEAGIEKVEKAVGVDNIYDAVSVNYVHQLTKALEAKELYHRDKDYLVADGEVKIVDEFTGRTLEGRRWSDGLHQAVEAKERVRDQGGEPHLGHGHAAELLPPVREARRHDRHGRDRGRRVRRHLRPAGGARSRPTSRWSASDQPDLIFKTEEAKFNAVVDDIVERYETGQPVLVGTASVAKSEQLSRLLEKRGIPHKVLNAKQHFREAEIVAQAGRLRRGHRGHQHGRPRRRHHPRRQPRGAGPPRGCAAEGVDLDDRGGRRASSTELPGRVRGASAGPRASEVRELGGLYVLGSERHESRRIDNQLRGRSGRQGDPGESRFFLSLEDELMRLFATGAMSWVMGRALPDDVPIEAKMVTKAIERAQNTVEGRNAEIRKDVLKYDEVMNEQRKVIYERRLQIIDGEDLEAHTEELLAATVEKLVRRALPDRVPRGVGPRAAGRRGHAVLPDAVHRRGPGARRRRPTQLVESLVDRGARVLRAARARRCPAARRRCARSSATSCCRSSTSAGATTWPRWTTCRRASTCAGSCQADPLVAWQREGYAMFGQLMDAIDDDYLRYIIHVEARASSRRPSPTSTGPSTRPPTTPWPRPALAGRWPPSRRADRRRRRACGAGRRRGRPARRRQRPAPAAPAQVSRRRPPDADALAPIVKAPHEKSAATSRAGAGAARSSSSAMAPPDAAAAGAEEPRDFAAELDGAGGPAGRGRALPRARQARGPPGRARGRGGRARTCGTTPTTPGRSPPSSAGSRDDLDQLDGLRADARRRRRRCSSWSRSRRRGRARRRARRPSSSRRSTALGTRLGALELQSLFSGEYDERDAVAEVHAGAGGTDAQDWAEMMLRMYQRWAERRGFAVEVDEATRGPGGRAAVGDLHRARAASPTGLLAAERGVHRLVRMSPFDSQHRRQTSFASVDVTPFLEDVVRRGRDRREGPAHRHLPLVGRRRPARQQDRLGRAPHPPADRDRGVVPERAQPAPEQGEGHADPRRPSWPSGRAPSAGPSSTR